MVEDLHLPPKVENKKKFWDIENLVMILVLGLCGWSFVGFIVSIFQTQAINDRIILNDAKIAEVQKTNNQQEIWMRQIQDEQRNASTETIKTLNEIRTQIARIEGLTQKATIGRK